MHDLAPMPVMERHAHALEIVANLEEALQEHALQPLRRVQSDVKYSNAKHGRPKAGDKGRERATTELLTKVNADLPLSRPFKGAKVILIDAETLSLQFPPNCGRSNMLGHRGATPRRSAITTRDDKQG